jgi:hypothetical protein
LLVVSALFSKSGGRSILFATGAVIFFEEIPQLIIYSVYMGSHIKPAIVPILVLSSCLMVLVLKSISLLYSICCYGKGVQVRSDDRTQVIENISEDEEETSTSTSDGASIPVPGPATNKKSDKLNIATGAAISGVTTLGGSAVRYIIIYLDDKKREKVATIKTITTKTSLPDGDKYITKTDNGIEYITIYNEKNVTKTSTCNEEYITRIDGDKGYVTKTISGEEYITTIISNDDKEYITKSKSISSKGNGQVEYIIITSSSFTNTETKTDEYGIVTETVTKTKTDENDNSIVKVIITKKDPNGKVLETNTETRYI